MENDINTLAYMANTLSNNAIVTSSCFETILRLIDSSKRYTAYILSVAEGLLINNKNDISPNVYKKIMNLDKNLVIKLITTINKYKNKEKIIDIISQVILKSLDINTIEHNLIILINKLEEILLIDDPDGINILLNLILKQINKITKEKITLSLPNKIRVIDNKNIKQFKFVG